MLHQTNETELMKFKCNQMICILISFARFMGIKVLTLGA